MTQREQPTWSHASSPSYDDEWLAGWMQDARAEELGYPVVYHASQLVSVANLTDGAARDVLMSTLLDSLIAQQQGSTRIPLSEEFQHYADDGCYQHVYSSDPKSYKPIVVEGSWIYHQRTLHYEVMLAHWVAHRLQRDERDTPAGVDAALRSVAENPTRLRDGTPIVLSAEQALAVRTASERSMTVVTGGPGTGKTSIVVSLLRTLTRMGIEPDDIALAAPTGKAANRLGESIETQLRSLEDPSAEDAVLIDQLDAPGTLHRLLRYGGHSGRFGRDKSDPIAASWVIVDEASMIDLVLMERLMQCVRPEAHLVLLGDVEQLPSVETGMVLRDVLGPDGAEHVVRLETSFRMDPRDPAGRSILQLAQTVRAGTADEIDWDASVQGVTFERHAVEGYRAELLAFVDEWFDARVTSLENFWALSTQTYSLEDGRFDKAGQDAVRELFRHFETFRILCLTRVFATGADALNEAFHLRMARRGGVAGIPDHIAGEPVMMLRNDYDRGLFNGDHGIVLNVETDEGERLAAVFPEDDGFRAHHLAGLGSQLAFAWAMTVHKSQGSEFDHVALILPEEDVPLLSRELLYTGLTRARRSVRVKGPPEFFALGVERTIERYSGLAERIFGAKTLKS